MENNPYEAELQVNVYQQKLQEITDMMEEVAAEEEQGESGENNENNENMNSSEAKEELVKLKKLKEYYSNALQFTETMCVCTIIIHHAVTIITITITIIISSLLISRHRFLKSPNCWQANQKEICSVVFSSSLSLLPFMYLE